MGEVALEAALESANPIELGRASRRAVEEAWQVFATLSSPIRPANLEGDPSALEDTAASGDFCSLEVAEARRHRVLVAGATGRVGRVVCNKLLLRGYKVRALVRRVDEESLAKLPAAVEIVQGDVTDMKSVAAATRGCDKVVCCIRAPPMRKILREVEVQGVRNLAEAVMTHKNVMQMRLRDEAKLVQGIAEMGGDVPPTTPPEAGGSRAGIGPGDIQVTKLTLSHSRYLKLRDRTNPDKGLEDLRERREAKERQLHPLDNWKFSLKGPGVQKLGEEEALELNPLRSGVLANGVLRAKGRITCGGVYAELSKDVRDIPRALGRTTLAGFEAILFKLSGGGKQYQAVVYTEEGPGDARQAYLAPFRTHATRECNVRIPFSRFRAAKPDAAPLDPAKIVEFGVRFLPPREALQAFLNGASEGAAAVTGGAVQQSPPRGGDVPPIAPLQTFRSNMPEAEQGLFGEEDGPPRQAPDPLLFNLKVNWVKALPGGTEPDFILVSATGDAVDADVRRTCMNAKKAAEASLRASGLGYTIVRPGPLQEVAGGQRGLVIEQSTGWSPGDGGDGVSGGAISCADVADVCIRCLHDEAAFNKTFEVSQEVVSQANEEMYELVATLPVDQRVQKNRSLAPALSRLEKNT